jgi:Ala-tRNA(Pro) deacylase
MGIPNTVSEFLHSHEVDFTVLPHRMTVTSMETAQAAHVPGDSLAKAVVLEDGERYVLAVIPATHRLDAIALEGLLDRELRMVGEQDFAVLFRDCRRGAVPAVGGAYGVATVVDVSLAARPDVYIESGDHENLIHVNRRGFERLMSGSERGAISYHV